MKFREWLLITIGYITLMFVSSYVTNGYTIKSYNYILWITSGWVEGSFVTWYILRSFDDNKDKKG